MGEDKENPSEISSVDLSKKRKLQDGQLGLPSPKYKFRDRSCLAHDDFRITDNEEETIRKDGGILEQCGSVWDSNSFTGECDIGMSVDDTEAKNKYEMGPKKSHHLDQPSTSSSSCSINNYRETIYHPTSSNLEGTYKREQVIYSGGDPNHANLVTTVSEDRTGFAMSYADYICEEKENYDDEQLLNLPADETMIYSNGMDSNLYLLSSGRWSINPDARLGARKPTIDQEFEQYFSMLML